MQPVRLIYEDAPAFIPVPPDFQHHRIEVTLWPLQTEEMSVSKPRRTPPPQLAGKARDLGDIMSTLPATDWGQTVLPSLADFRAALPHQDPASGSFCQNMCDEDRY
jgi:hypothetical protein